MSTFFLCALLICVIFEQQFLLVTAHGLMIFPNPRGGLNRRCPWIENNADPEETTTVDFGLHFPAGVRDKSTKLSGLSSQRREYRKISWNKKWELFNPADASFRWRAGVCGDPRSGPNKNNHLRGGKFYNNAMRAATFTQGDIISIEISINAHHNGFMELWVCDAAKCGGEISEECFRQKNANKACYRLERATNWKCDSKKSFECGPKDENYPGRFYLPCAKYARPGYQGAKTKNTRYGFGNIKYKLPPNLNCDHCVMHWYWTAANLCNPDGVKEYFTGPNAPEWGQCEGQSNARGGWAEQKPKCGEIFPEEYNLCSDIRIRSKSEVQAKTTQRKKPLPSPWPFYNGPKEEWH